MNDDTAAKIERTGWSLVQWTTRLAVVLGIAGIIFGLLFYFAHQAEPLATKLPYAIAADKPGTGGASQYLLAGTVASVDMASKTIRILGSDGREYVFALRVRKNISSLAHQRSDVVARAFFARSNPQKGRKTG